MEDLRQFITNAETALPTNVALANSQPAAGQAHGIQYVIPLHGKKHALALMDRYFVLKNATPGTGIVSHTAPDLADDLKPLIHLRNSYTRPFMMDYILLTVTAAGGSDQTAIGFKVALEPGSAGTRYASAGTAYTAASFHSPYSESNTSPSLSAHVGACVATAESTNCRSWFRHAREVDRVIGDNYILDFGCQDFRQTGNVLGGTTQANIILPFPSVVMGPNAELFVHEKAPSQTTTGAAYEFEIAGWVL